MAAGEAQRAVGDLFRMTRPLKRPMRVALPDALQGFNPYASQSQPSAASRFSVVNIEALGLGHFQRASSLSLAMGLTTILTTIWVCPPKYTRV